MPTIKQIIERAIEVAEEDAPLQMQLIRKILEDIYGGTWGVLIVKNTDLVSTSVHWTIPDHKHTDGSPAFCLYAGKKNWQYNVFKTGNQDTNNRLTVEEVINRLQSKPDSKQIVITEFDQQISEAIRRRVSST
uniref:DUF1801 domain-containing protein n=1 Tax=Acrobeloides nanus TaxID=290746 RepID=A0A914E079_9BILA